MKRFFTAFVLLSTAGILMAGETPQTLGKFRFVHTGPDNQRTEVETQSVIEYGEAAIPLLFPGKSVWVCSVNVELESKTASFRVQTPAANESKTPVPLLQVTMPLRNGEEMVLVKSPAFTLTATVTLPAGDPAVEAGNRPVEMAAKALTEAELGQVPIKTIRQSGLLNIRGYNPFGKRLGDGVLRITVPKTGSAPEITRDYAVSFNAEGLADFGSQIHAALEIPQGVEPVCKLVKLHFR